jgi:hypothetical protein
MENSNSTVSTTKRTIGGGGHHSDYLPNCTSHKKVFKIDVDSVKIGVDMLIYVSKDPVSPVSILKRFSSFPRPHSVEDSPPTPIANRGHLKHFTYNRHGDVIPIRGSPWFVDQWFQIKASGAIERLAASKERRRQDMFERRRLEQHAEEKIIENCEKSN